MDEPAALTTSEVLKVASLARLALPAEQVEDYRTKLVAVIGYANRLRSVDLTGVEPLSSPMELTGTLGEDVPGPTLPTQALMNMAPETLPPFLRVPKVIGD